MWILLDSTGFSHSAGLGSLSDSARFSRLADSVEFAVSESVVINYVYCTIKTIEAEEINGTLVT